MKINKPINIWGELIFFLGSIGFLVFANRTNLLNRALIKKIWDFWIWIGFFSMITLITIRSIKKEEAKRFISTFYFGLISGCYFWILFVIVESKTGKVSKILEAVISVLGFGLLAGFVASIWSFFLFTFFKKWFSGFKRAS